jgi:hypothetical protein
LGVFQFFHETQLFFDGPWNTPNQWFYDDIFFQIPWPDGYLILIFLKYPDPFDSGKFQTQKTIMKDPGRTGNYHEMYSEKWVQYSGMLHALQWSCCGIKVEHKKVNRKHCSSSFALHSKKVKRYCLQHFVFSPEALAFYLGSSTSALCAWLYLSLNKKAQKKDLFSSSFTRLCFFWRAWQVRESTKSAMYVCKLWNIAQERRMEYEHAIGKNTILFKSWEYWAEHNKETHPTSKVMGPVPPRNVAPRLGWTAGCLGDDVARGAGSSRA